MKSEFELIQYIKSKASAASRQPPAVSFGIGDDCAVIPKDTRTDLVITTDLLIEDVDFRIDWTTPEFLGHKALAVSLSDVAAMGAKPAWALLSIGIPEKIWKTDFVERFYDGWFALAEKFNVELVGGDVSRTPDKIVIDSIAAGNVKKGKAVLRSTAKPNDLIVVSGALGSAAIGLELLESGERFEPSKKQTSLQKLLLRQLRPSPQTELGRILGENNLVSAMIDLSDGLSSDLAHLCSASKTGAKIFADKIPAVKFLTQRRKNAKRDELREIESQSPKTKDQLYFALNGGEDFELLFTVNPKKNFHIKKKLKNNHYYCIGEITANAEIIELTSGEETRILRPKGFRHF
jgi:thiamine-monophosphate kinase